MPRLADVIKMDLADLVGKFLPPEKNAETGMVMEYLRQQYFNHEWRGNVRELRSLIYDFVLRGLDQSPPRPSFEKSFKVLKQDVADNSLPEEIANVCWTEEELLNWYRNRAIDKYKTKNKAADALGRHPRTLERLSKKEKKNEN